MNLSRLNVFLLVLLFSGCLFDEDSVKNLPDSDGDGFPDVQDIFPEDPFEWRDNDQDSIGDNADADDDNDGYNDTVEIELLTNPLDNLSMPPDNDMDFLPDVWDIDDDNDCYSDDMEIFENSDPFNASMHPPDNDLDCIGDGTDWDDDNDSVTDDGDAFPMDPAASSDSDGDGMPDWWRPGFNETTSTTNLTLDPFQDDYDNDAVSDDDDAFPRDPAASIDSDNDGYPDSWNPGYKSVDSISNLELDQFPNSKRLHSWGQVVIIFLFLSAVTYFGKDIKFRCTHCGGWLHEEGACLGGWHDDFDDDDYSKPDKFCGYCDSKLNQYGECPEFDLEHDDFFRRHYGHDEPEEQYSSEQKDYPLPDWTPEQLRTLEKALKLKCLYDDASKDDSTVAQNEAQAALHNYLKLLKKVGLSEEDLRQFQNWS